MPAITMPRARSIGDASRETGVKVETIRYYERIGLMPRPDRTAGGNRLYDGDAIGRLRFIRRCRELGFGIDEIRAFLAMAGRNDFTCGEVYDMTVRHLATVKAKIASLQRLAGVLDGMASACSRGEVPVCPILDALWDEPSAPTMRS